MRYSIIVLFIGISSLFFACSNKSGDDSSGPTNGPPPNTETVNSGTDPASPTDNTTASNTDGGNTIVFTDGGPKVPTNQAECLAACEAQHPEGKVKADAITTCWNVSCNNPCLFMPDRLDHNVSPADAGTTCGVPELPILVPSPSCAQCTQDHCCAQWADCFSSLQADCTLLNQCASECWTKFPQ